jgi:aminobenzoyl-glutamate utilization protein B
MWDQVKDYVVQYIEDHKDEFWEVSRKIWENPELGMEETFASAELQTLLKNNGFTVESNVAGMPTAFVGTYGDGVPTIGFSSEFDALPGLSQDTVPYKKPISAGFPGHGCGHNLIAIGGLMAAVALKNAMEKFNFSATLKVFGTPAEELCIGKPIMASAGCFKGVDIFLDYHPLTRSASNATGCFSYFSIKYHYKGKTAHGNTPWHGRSALDGAMLQAQAIEMMREHIDPGNGEYKNTINWTFSDTGPEFASVVPDRATLWCIGRFATSEEASDVIRRVDNCASAAALAMDLTVEKEYLAATHEYIPNLTASKVVYDNLLKLGDVEFTEEEENFVAELQKNEGQEAYKATSIAPFGEDIGGVTDSSEYSWFAPTTFLQIKLGPGPGWHNWMVTSCAGSSHGKKSVTKASQVLGASAIDFIADKTVLEASKKEWEDRLKGRVYRSLLPEGTPVPIDINKEAMEKYRK